MATETAQRFQFSSCNDLLLLKQIIANRLFVDNPGKRKLGWHKCALNLKSTGLISDSRSLRDRFNLLMRKFKSDDLAGLRNTSTDIEEVNERAELLAAINSQIIESDRILNEKKAREEASKNTACEIRKDAMENLKDKSCYNKSNMKDICSVQNSRRNKKSILKQRHCKNLSHRRKTDNYLNYAMMVEHMMDDNVHQNFEKMRLKEIKFQKLKKRFDLKKILAENAKKELELKEIQIQNEIFLSKQREEHLMRLSMQKEEHLNLSLQLLNQLVNKK
jgi:hypothetical protein